MHSHDDLASLTPTKKADIVIVGGGVIGLTVANLVQHLNAKVVLVDAASLPDIQLDVIDPRVLAVSKKSEDIFSKISVWNKVVAERACAYQKMYVWDGEGTGNISFDCRDRGQDTLGTIVENKILSHALNDQLTKVEKIYHAQVERFACLGERSIVVLSNGDTVEASLVIAADGANSHLRELANIPTKEWEYGHTAIVTTVATVHSHQNTAWQVFGSEGPLAFLPLQVSDGDEHHCSIVWSLNHEFAQRQLEKNDEDFCHSLERYFEKKLGKVLAVEKRFSFPLRQRHATQYGAPGLILVGDAAHTIHPLAGQGANIGFYDAEILAKEIERAEKRRLPFSDMSIGQRYQRQRQGDNLAAMATMEGFKRLFASDDPAIRYLRNEGLRIVNNIPLLKNTFSSLAGGR